MSLCKCGSTDVVEHGADGNNRLCNTCAARWHEDNCWKCHAAIDSRIPGVCRCKGCGWYECPKCGVCESDQCATEQFRQRESELAAYDPDRPTPSSELDAFLAAEAGGDDDELAALRANLDLDD